MFSIINKAQYSVITETSISPLQKQKTPGHFFPGHETRGTHFACLVCNTTKNSTCLLKSPSVHQHCLPAHPRSDLEASWVFFSGLQCKLTYVTFEIGENICSFRREVSPKEMSWGGSSANCPGILHWHWQGFSSDENLVLNLPAQ